MIRACFLCAGTAADGAILPAKKPALQRRLCASCSSLPALEQEKRMRLRLQQLASAPSRPRSRRSYRAAWRHRQASAQLDLVDLVVPCP